MEDLSIDNLEITSGTAKELINEAIKQAYNTGVKAGMDYMYDVFMEEIDKILEKEIPEDLLK